MLFEKGHSILQPPPHWQGESSFYPQEKEDQSANMIKANFCLKLFEIFKISKNANIVTPWELTSEAPFRKSCQGGGGMDLKWNGPKYPYLPHRLLFSFTPPPLPSDISNPTILGVYKPTPLSSWGKLLAQLAIFEVFFFLQYHGTCHGFSMTWKTTYNHCSFLLHHMLFQLFTA